MNYTNYQYYQNKKFVIDTLINLADSSPVRKTYQNNIHGISQNHYDISQQELNIWMDYINSVLDILSDYISQAKVSMIKAQIRNIASKNASTPAMCALNIERELLKLARNILAHYP